MTSSDDTTLAADGLTRLEGTVGSHLVGDTHGQGLRIALACAKFNGGITTRLLDGALAALAEHDVDRADVSVAWVPGAFELPLVARAYARAGTVDAVVCLGAVIRGDTGHYDFVAGECAAGLQRVSLDTGVPVIFGVLTTDTVKQALVRSEPHHRQGADNKGVEAALTALEMVRLLRSPPLTARAG